jgi:dihydroorotate dehydrogenase (NAD+) catalytic subunit
MKRDLYFSKPLMNAAGSLGFSPDPRNGISFDSFGAFVTNPLSLRPRLPTPQPAMLEYPGGFLMHTGLPNPGLSSAIKKHEARWSRSGLSIIIHLMADRPEETKKMVQSLENMDSVMAVELGFAPLLSDDIISLTLEMCLGEIPLIFCLPVEQILSLGPKLIQAGAAAISISSPRGALVANSSSLLVTGRIYGPSLFPRSLEIVHSAVKIGLPIIGSGGVWSEKQVADMLSAGATAVQVDASLWVPKEAVNS